MRLVAIRVCVFEDAVNGRWVWVVDRKTGTGGWNGRAVTSAKVCGGRTWKWWSWG